MQAACWRIAHISKSPLVKPQRSPRKRSGFPPDLAQEDAPIARWALLLLEIPVFLGLPTLLRVPALGAGDAALRARCCASLHPAIVWLWADVIEGGGWA